MTSKTRIIARTTTNKALLIQTTRTTTQHQENSIQGQKKKAIRKEGRERREGRKE